MNRELLEVIAGQALNYFILIRETDEVFSNLYDEGLLDISKDNEEEYENYKEKMHYFIKFIYDEGLLGFPNLFALPNEENNDEKLIFTHKIKLTILLFNEIYKDTTPEMTDEEFRQVCLDKVDEELRKLDEMEREIDELEKEISESNDEKQITTYYDELVNFYKNDLCLTKEAFIEKYKNSVFQSETITDKFIEKLIKEKISFSIEADNFSEEENRVKEIIETNGFKCQIISLETTLSSFTIPASAVGGGLFGKLLNRSSNTKKAKSVNTSVIDADFEIKTNLVNKQIQVIYKK